LKGLNGEPEIIVDNQEIIIGRNEEICSHVIENKSIGRAHIKINMGLSGCFITDLDSKNGTYLNGEKLLSNKEYPLNNNDRLLLANTEYCFCSP
jgi:pSer/pThr/pTyr-binding forkhead associated (FHA) protein